tara:strand:- start:184 stop:615 length:432 start_codon:yes stop_codon:yes gene_type:complete
MLKYLHCIVGFMAGEDFQKGDSKGKSGLGLREVIEETLTYHEFETRKRAEELFMELKIIERVKASINNGKSECLIFLPDEFRTSPHNVFQGNNTYSDLFNALRSLLESEGVSCRPKMGKLDWDSDINFYSGLIIFNYFPEDQP